MSFIEDMVAFAAANKLTTKDDVFLLDQEVLNAISIKFKETFSKEKLHSMLKEGSGLLKTMIEELNPQDVDRKIAEELLAKTENFIKKEESEIVKQEPQKIYISWDDMTNAITKHIAPKISKKFPDIDTILCVTRGGLVPAGILAYALNIKNIVNIKVESYDDENAQKEMKLTKLSKRDIKTLNKAKGILIVDDIFDTGSTFLEIYEYLAQIGKEDLVNKTEFFSIVTKDYSEDEFCVYNLTGDERWVEFPWNA